MRVDGVAQDVARVEGARRPETAIPRRAVPAVEGTPEAKPPDSPAPEVSAQAAGQLDEKATSQLDEVVQTVNDQLFRVNQRMELYVVEGTNEVAARIVDTRSNEVVRSIPPKEVLELRSRMREMLGLLCDKGA